MILQLLGCYFAEMVATDPLTPSLETGWNLVGLEKTSTRWKLSIEDGIYWKTEVEY